MDRLSELVRLHRLGEGPRNIARQLGMSPNTEREYRRILERAGFLEGDAGDLPELSDLRAAIEAAKPTAQLIQHKSSVESWRPEIDSLLKDGAQPKAIFDRLKLDDRDFDGSLSAVKRLCAALRRDGPVRPGDVAITVDTVPGQVAQVDFGSVGKLWDPESKRVRNAYVFVMVLGHSRHQFARLVFDQKIESWLALHVEAFQWFGGVPEVIVPDNLKSAVVRAAFDVRTEPVLNRSYRELARHFGFKIDPTPAYDPKKKGKVENGVRYFKSNFMATIGDERDIEELNHMVDRWVRETAGTRTHGTTHKQPLEHFESTERASLRELPTTPWKPVWWREPTVHRDSCGLVEKARYSVPWRLIGKKLLARVTKDSVELYWDDTRVATHERQPEGGRSIHPGHLPSERADYRIRDPEYWTNRAGEIGCDARAYIIEVFESDDVLSQMTKVQSIVRRLESVPSERANAACRRASYFGSYTYMAIKNILRKGLDLEPLPQIQLPRTDDTQRPRFARNVQELLDFTTNDPDASH